MDYRKHYQLLVERAKNRKLESYSERHHIIPRCLGGSDDEANLVSLTPEEHYLAHQLLVKMYPGNPKLVYAANMMIPNRPSNKMYGWLKRRFSTCISENQTGAGNSQFGKFWVTDGVNSKKVSINDVLPEGWKRGRVGKFQHKTKRVVVPSLTKELKLCVECFNAKKSSNGRIRAISLYRAYVQSGKTMSEFVNDTLDIKLSAFSRLIHRHISKEEMKEILGELT